MLKRRTAPACAQKRSVALMYAMAFLQGMVFYGSAATLYRTDAGLTMGQVSWIETVYYLLVVALEVPLGAVCARLGYRRMIVGAGALFFASKVIFWQAHTFGVFLAERVLLAVVNAGLSGCDDAYLYLVAGPENAQRALGRYAAFGEAGLLAASGLYTVCLAGQYRAAALWTAAAYGAALLCTFGLAEVPMTREDRAGLGDQLRGMAGNLRANPAFVQVLLADGLLCLCGQMVTVFFSQLLYLRAGASDTALGALYILMALTGLAGAWSHRAGRLLGRAFGPALCAAAAGGCVLAGLGHSLAAAAAGVFLVQVAWRLWGPFSARLQNDNVTRWGGARSVVLSGYSMAVNLFSSALNPALGGLADASLTGALALAAALCALAGALMAAFAARRRA